MTLNDKQLIGKWAREAHPDWWAMTQKCEDRPSKYHAYLVRLVKHMAKEEPELAIQLSCRTLQEAGARIRLYSKLLHREIVLGEEYSWSEVAALRGVDGKTAIAFDKAKRELDGTIVLAS